MRISGHSNLNTVLDNKIDIRKKIKETEFNDDFVTDATFFTICRNADLGGIKESIRTLEERFNKNYHYPWVFANDEPFTEEFKQEISKTASGDVIFTVIPKEYWDIPEHIDQNLMGKKMKSMKEEGVLYGDSVSYRKMCRFNSGFFYKLEALSDFNWYWRVEPDITYNCNIIEDPFKIMVDEGKVYGFALAMTEDKKTVRKLWKTSREYFESREGWSSELNDGDQYRLIYNTSLGFIEQDTDVNKLIRGQFNYCHYWSNFEIGNLNFFRGEEYDGYFETLDATGNFFYERWGDAPIHSIAVSYMLPPEKIKYFDNTGYFHQDIGNCPRDRPTHSQLQCSCSRYKDFSWQKWSCVPRWFAGLNIEPLHKIHHRKF